MNDERLGHKTNKGFYDYPKERKAKPTLCTDLAGFQTGQTAANLSDEQIIDRLILTMVNEAALCLDEQVVEGAVELDLATVFGTGFAPFRGGLLHYADSLGLPEVVRRLQAIADADDIQSREGGVDKFTPAPLLKRMAENGERFFD